MLTTSPPGRLASTWAVLLRRAGWILAGSLAVHLVLTVLATDMFDLKVYYQGAPSLLHGRLYDFVLHRADPNAAQLPFTYPPFAALLFLPLSALPWAAAATVWQLLSLASLALLVHCSFRLLGRGHQRRHAMLWFALALWLEPVKHGLDLGQIDLVLAAVVLAGITYGRSLAAGAGVAVAAGVKLVPAITGLYFLVTRQWRAACWSAVVFFATVGVAWAVDPAESHRYWFELLGDPSRIGQVASFENQSLRGALARTLGHDGGMSPLWCALALGMALAAAPALRTAARHGEALAVLVVTQLLGLLYSPISWSHHWVWFLPTLICLVHGPARHSAVGRLAIGAWLAATGSWLVPAAGHAAAHVASGHAVPWYLIALDWCYPVCALLSFLALALAPRPAPAAGVRMPHQEAVPAPALD
ncbi:glycosyltransferase 87 family protein [Kitasatospora viridis]|uniref:Alpha-1,2-mannosyltransferase n=1 Tax=Kitasatospora viridis TaxID=281105 RepID=A0A561UNN8_9ACTN|nr:glycosyltransferase 87 family protein [Kitasatospora viridis]TWG00988.1 alpha-1,2-mannosyltransferase [Kitasatospora viridis]